jgi:hypothetical protein
MRWQIGFEVGQKLEHIENEETELIKILRKQASGGVSVT